MPKLLVEKYRRRDWMGDLFAIHAHMGRAEWKESLPMCQMICKQNAISLMVVKREKGDLAARWQERMEEFRGQDKPDWPSARAR